MDRLTELTLDIAGRMLFEPDLDSVLERVLSAAQELTNARYVALGVLDAAKTGLERFTTIGIDDATRERIGQLPSGRGVLGELIRNPVPLRLSDIGSHPRSFGFPREHPPMRTLLGVPIIVQGEPYGNLYLTDKEDGSDFTEEDEQQLTMLAGFAAVAIANARELAEASRRRDDAERSVAALEATIDIGRALGGETKLGVILELVAKRARALVSAEAVLIELIEGDSLVLAASAGVVPASLVGQRVALDPSLAAHALRTARTQRLEDGLNRVRFEEHGIGSYGVHASAGLAVPLIFRGRAHGVLFALDRLEGGPEFSADDVNLLEAFAASAATAVATAQSVANERRRQRVAAAEVERARWARELHDDTLQTLGALRLGLSAAERSGDGQRLTEATRVAVDQLEEAIVSLRALITDLRPAALHDLGVQPAVEGLVERSNDRGLHTELEVDLAYEQGRDRTRLLSDIEVALYRTVQEALNNALKHGDARSARVAIVEMDGSVTVTVHDDGRGFDPADHNHGFGLIGMRERVEMLDGTLHIDSDTTSGTLIRARIPALHRDRDAA